MKIRAKTISFSAWKKKQAINTERGLEKEISALSIKVAEGDLGATAALSDKQTQLVELRKSKMEGVLIRSKTRWMERGKNLPNISLIWRSVILLTNQLTLLLTTIIPDSHGARTFSQKLVIIIKLCIPTGK